MVAARERSWVVREVGRILYAQYLMRCCIRVKGNSTERHVWNSLIFER